MNNEILNIFTISKSIVQGVRDDYYQFHSLDCKRVPVFEYEDDYKEFKEYITVHNKEIDCIVRCTGDNKEYTYFVIQPELEEYLSIKHKSKVEELLVKLNTFHLREQSINNATFLTRLKYLFTGKLL